MQVVKQDNKMNASQPTLSPRIKMTDFECYHPQRVALIELCVIPCILKIILSNMCISLNSILCVISIVFEF